MAASWWSLSGRMQLRALACIGGSTAIAQLSNVGHALMSHMLEIGLIEYYRTGIDYEGRQADFYFLLGQSPLSN